VRLHRPTLLWSYALLAPALIFILTSLDRGYQTDLWHHLARGREMCQTGAIVNRDLFTYTVTDQPLMDNNWLTQVTAYKLYQLGGLNLVQAANSVLLALAVAIVVGIGLRQGAPIRACAFVGVLMVAGLSSTLLIRPQTVSMLLFVVLLAILIAAERRRWLLAIVPLLMILWANTHGAFPIGLVLIGCFTAAACVQAVRSRGRISVSPLWMLECFMASALATLVNPYGWHVYEYVRTTSSRATARVIQEWLRPNVFTLSGAIWITTVIAMIVLAIANRRRVRPWMAITGLVFLAGSCTSVRMSIWWYFTAAPIAMALWPLREDQTERPSPATFAATASYAVIAGIMILCLPAMQRWNPIFSVRPSDRPEENIQQLADVVASQSPGARVFSRLEWGEYLSFALPWKQSIYMDGRIEIYPDNLWDEYSQITSAAPEWESALARRGVTVLMLDRHYHDGLIAAASKSPNWREVATIGGGVIFVRNAEARMPTAE